MTSFAVPHRFPPRRDLWVRAGLALLIFAGLAAVAAATDWRAVLHQIARVGPGTLALLLALSLVNYLARGLRWHRLAHSLGLPLRLPRAVLHFVAGLAMSVTPGRVGELVRLRWTAHDTGAAAERALPLALADRAFDLAAMALLLAIAAAVTPAAGLAAPLAALLALGIALAVTRPRLLASLATLAHRATGRAPRRFAGLRAAARGLSALSAPRIALAALALGLLGWGAEALAFDLLLAALGTDLPLARATLIFTLATLAGGLTGAPGGLGGAEAAMVGLLIAAGVPPATALAATVVIRLTTLWFGLALGTLAFPFAEAGRRCTS